jgi:hypothetical protein
MLEESLRLHASQRCTRLKLSTYLHDLTGGMNRQPVSLVREAALDAILDEERIPRASQERVDLARARSSRTSRAHASAALGLRNEPVITPGPAPCTTSRPRRDGFRLASSGFVVDAVRQGWAAQPGDMRPSADRNRLFST